MSQNAMLAVGLTLTNSCLATLYTPHGLIQVVWKLTVTP